ncbi:PREDICTED: protein indeterminate-domain 12-like isoform X3 [Lupinus angustifolius]|uniref:protein indeterminate-domain 12-like isoform X3 n=1 Tax=Lupinus angustifolius TaxID=3871 RepID=UPI00092F5CBC|nr:PREDICTED: protein indeterminate-domain 12-like isoform X3 [Lupinus angustifolius]
MCLCATYSLARFSLIISCVQTKAITLSLSHTHRERPSNKYIARIWKEETKKQTKTLEYRILLFFPCIFPPPTWSFSSKAMFPAVMSNSTSISEEASVLSSGARIHQDLGGLNNLVSSISPQKQPQLKIKKKRSLPGNPDPDAEVIALSPKTLLATNRFVCEICNKGFQRDQNLQLHRRGHNLPWKLKQRSNKEVKKKAYVCPEASCVHHNPSRALGDLTGIKKHYCRKHGEKKWKCDKCSKIYAVQSDWKAHSKTCGTREYRCDCGTLFSRKDSFITHRAFCDALAEESARMSANQIANNTTNPLPQSLFCFPSQQQNFQNQFTTLNPWDPSHENPNPSNITTAFHNIKPEAQNFHIPHNNNSNNSPSFLHHSKGIITSSPFRNLYMHSQNSSNSVTSAYLSATALLQKAATVGASAITGPNASTTVSVGGDQQQHVTHHVTQLSMGEFGTMAQLNNSVIPDHHHYINMKGLSKNETRDFLGLANGGGGRGDSGGNAVEVSINVKDMLTFTGNVEYQNHHQGGFGFIGTTTAPESWGNC